MAVNELLRRLLSNERARPQGAYIAPTYGQAKRIAWSYCRDFAGAIPGTNFNESELRIDLPGEKRIWLLGAENPDRLRGLYLDYVVLDECADINPRLFPEIIRPALAERNGGAFWIGTPRGYNHFWDVFDSAKRSFESGNPDWYACLFKASETNLIPEVELAAAAQNMSAEQYEQEFECSFNAAISGAYYGRLISEAEREDRIRKLPWEPIRPVHTAWDLGISDSTAIWFFQEAQGARHYIDFYEAAGEGLIHFAKILSSKPYVYGGHFLPHDVRVRELGSGKSRLEILRELGIQSRVTPRLSVQDGIEASRVLLRTCAFDQEKTGPGLDALRQYRRLFDPARRHFSDKPLHDWTSHAADAFRISATAETEICRPDLRKVAKTGRTESGEAAVVDEYAIFD